MNFLISISIVVVFSILLLGSAIALDENADKRSHNHGPMWIEHCWDTSNETHNLDPFCSVLFEAGCGKPADVDNGDYQKPYDSHLDAQVNYVCDDGYLMVGPEFIKCGRHNKSLQWSKPPTCVMTACTDVPIVPNASFGQPNSTEIGTVVTYTCDTGYELVSGNTIECLPGAVWSKPYPGCRPVCPSVPEVANGHTIGAISSSIGTTVEYECNEGYTLADNNSTVCVFDKSTFTGSWSKPIPSCIEITCNTPELSGTTEFTSLINETMFYINDTVEYRCIDGYSFIDQPSNEIKPDMADETHVDTEETTSTTMEHMTTTTEPPTYDMDMDTDMDNETYGDNETMSMENTTTTAEPPTTTTTEPLTTTTELHRQTQTATCQLVGNKAVWTNIKSCAVDCWPIPNVDNAIHSSPKHTYVGTVVEYSCKIGNRLVGPKSITCMNDGTWSALPYCEPDCMKPTDIVFIVDGSGSVGTEDFKKELAFVTDMVTRYEYETTHFGMLVYSTAMYLQFYLNEFTTNRTELINKIQSTSFPSGITNTSGALKTARTDIFTDVHGMRPNVSLIAIIITDGRSMDANKTSHEAELLRNEGVTIYSIGVGNADSEELNRISSHEKLVFHVDNFSNITSVEGPLAEISCE